MKFPPKTQERDEFLKNLQIGNKVTRWLAGTVPMDMTVTHRGDEDHDVIHCDEWWMFHPTTGGEIDPDIGFDGVSFTGSWISPPHEPLPDEPC